jgi:hypothetical protein
VLLFILMSGLIGAAGGFALALPHGWLVLFAASAIGGAVGIFLAGAWIAFAQQRRNAQPKPPR